MSNRSIATYSDDELRMFAKGIARSITVRWNSGNMSRETTEPERKIIECAVFGALESARMKCEHPEMINSILFTAECILDGLIPECNGYETIFMDLNSLLTDNDKEIMINEDCGQRLTYGMEVQT